MIEQTAQLLYSRVLLQSSRSRPDRPFFPFLEYHDPAPGAESMGEDWSVIACQVCSAFLIQQWETFERTRMPINKRLYWLKRPSGCEIRQPVSQIELEEILNEHSREAYGDKQDYDTDEEMEPQETSNSVTDSSSVKSGPA